MAAWFAKLMQKGLPRSPRASGGVAISGTSETGSNPAARDARYDVIVQTLRDREAEDRDAREKRQRWYRQHLANEPVIESDASGANAPIRLHKFSTKVPCRVTPEARALLAELRRRFPRSTITFPQVLSGRQVVMLTTAADAEPRQIGWVESFVEADPKRCNVRNQGLSVETDGGRMLVLRFRYPPTTVKVSARRKRARALPRGAGGPGAPVFSTSGNDGFIALPNGEADDVAAVEFTEIRPVLDPRPSEKASSPRLVWVTRPPEVGATNAIRSRDYEAFYARLKLEVLAGIWTSLSGVLSSMPTSQWHQGSHFTVVRESDAANGKIHQRTVDDGGRALDIGWDRVYDAFPATDILLLYLEGDILADFADIYFTLQSLSSADAYFLKEEYFSVIRRFWAGAQSLTSRYGSDQPTIVRMSQRAVPMPAQIPLLKQDWITLRQALVDRYGEGGRKAAELIGQDAHRPRTGPLGWPFASYPAGEVNIGLRLVYRQEWRYLGAQRGDVIRRVPSISTPLERESSTLTPAQPPRAAVAPRSVETTIEHSDVPWNLGAVVNEAVKATVEAMKWPRDFEGSINTGVRALAATTDMGVEAETRESSRDTSTRLTDIVRRMANRLQDARAAAVSAEPEAEAESAPPAGGIPDGQDGATYVYSRLQNWYEVLTRPAEIQNVVMVAEKLPVPAEIELGWVRRNERVLAKALLDESFRDTLDTIGVDAAEEETESQRDAELDGRRDRLFDHLRANILHYLRAIWQEEDPQLRSMRYRKSGKKVPLDWRFELESGSALTIDELGDRLAAASVDAQFATYSSGREADLDQLIDPAGPIGFYGNYAIYHMRPEFGSEDLFSMLHFFKSPWLRPNPDTGEPEVADPEQIQLAEDPGVLGASEATIDEQREEMLRRVPELRMYGPAGEAVGEGADADAAEASPSPEAFRRHFATYLFRRERARRIALDTDGVVIDVIRAIGSLPGQERDAVDMPGVPAGYQLMLEVVRGTPLLTVNGNHDPEDDWMIHQREGRIPALLAGVGVGTRSSDAEVPLLLVAAADGNPSAKLLAGVSTVTPRGAQGEWRIVERNDDAPKHRLLAGGGNAFALDQEWEGLILLLEDREGSVRAGAGAAWDRLVVARDDEWLRPSPVTGNAGGYMPAQHLLKGP